MSRDGGIEARSKGVGSESEKNLGLGNYDCDSLLLSVDNRGDKQGSKVWVGLWQSSVGWLGLSAVFEG